MDVGLMIEGQNGLTWPHWTQVLDAAESLGFRHVFRSDHYTNAGPPDRDSLECWTSLTYAATRTTRIEFGPLVSPITFRHPALLARIAASVDDLSNGRLTLGMGIGWQDREHEQYGIPFPSVDTRYGMLEDGINVATRLLRRDDPTSYEGRYFQLHDAVLLPRPQRPGGPPLLIGGNGARRTLPLAARYADEWNAVFVSPGRFAELNARLDGLLDDAGRARDVVRRSAMVGSLFCRDDAVLQRTLVERGWDGVDPERAVITGTPEMWVEQLSAYRAAGVQRIMVQWLDLDDLSALEIIGRDVLPAFA